MRTNTRIALVGTGLAALAAVTILTWGQRSDAVPVAPDTLAFLAQAGGSSAGGVAGGAGYTAWGTTSCAVGFRAAYTGVMLVGEAYDQNVQHAGYALTNTICSATNVSSPTVTNVTGKTRLQNFQNGSGSVPCAVCVR